MPSGLAPSASADSGLPALISARIRDVPDYPRPGIVFKDITPLLADGAAFAAPVWSGEPLVASAHTQHAAGTWGYVVTCNVGADNQPHATRVGLASLGEDLPATDSVVLYDWRTGRVEILPADGAYEVALEPAGWDYRIVAPVLPGDIAVIGDPALYAKDPAETARLTERRTRLAERLTKAEAAWLAAAEAYEAAE